MAINRIYVKNFKTFADADIKLDCFNILIGPNASGKSNFVDMLRFLRDIASDGLGNAISLQGGVDYLTNKNVGPAGGLSMRVWTDEPFTSAFHAKDGLIGLRVSGSDYEFSLEFSEVEPRTRVVKDVLTVNCDFVRMEKVNNELREVAELGRGLVTVSNVGGKPHSGWAVDGVVFEDGELFPWLPFGEQQIPADALLLETPHVALLLSPIQNYIQGLSIYDFDPKLLKRSALTSGKRDLEEDGSNLAIVLNAIRTDDDKRRKLTNLVRDLLPFVEDIDTDRLEDKSLLFKLRETYTPDYLPAWLMSDGTVNVAALVVALYFENRRLMVIEEPERNIHPSLIRKVVAMMKEASAGKQIIVTTHSPEMVKYADLEDVILITRGGDGCSEVSRPAEQEAVRTFLQNEIGIEDLYVDNLLGA